MVISIVDISSLSSGCAASCSSDLFTHVFALNSIVVLSILISHLSVSSINNTLIKNDVVDNKNGISLHSSSNKNQIINNIVSNNKGRGINIVSSDENIINNNKILSNNITGIYLYNSKYCKIIDCEINNNIYGINLSSLSRNNYIINSTKNGTIN